MSSLVDSALERAGDNAGQLRKALDEAEERQRTGVRFLLAHMPDHDLQTLSAEFILENVRLAYQAWDEAPWQAHIGEDLFLNEVLPYACINERRDDWRADFYRRFKPLVAEADTPGEAAVIVNQHMCKLLNVRFSRGRPKADQSPLETIEAGMASCTGLSVLLVDACRAVGVPARFAGTPLWSDRSGNHSWVEVWDQGWHYTGGGEPSGGKLDSAWFTAKAASAQRDQRRHAIYATSFKRTDVTFPMVWDRRNDSVYAVNVTDRYTPSKEEPGQQSLEKKEGRRMDVEASLHAVDQLRSYLEAPVEKRGAIDEQGFATVALTRENAREARRLLWADHVERIKQSRADEMEARLLTAGDLEMPFNYTVSGDKPEHGRSLYISMHGGGGAPKRVNDRQWENQKRLYKVPEGVYLAPRAPTDTWNLWHQGHIDMFFDRLITNLIVFEGVDPNRVYLLGYSAGGDGVYQLAPRMADRLAAAAMMAGHPNEASPLGLRNIAFTIHVGGDDSPYNRNEVARQWGEKLDKLQEKDPQGYVHWTRIYEGKGHWLDGEDAEALPWMADYTRDPLPKRVVWKQDDVTHPRFYWLAVKTEDQHGGAEIRGHLQGQTFQVQATGVDGVIIRVNDQMLNLDEAVTVTSTGRKLYKGYVERTIGTLARTLEERGDPALVFSGEIAVTLTKRDGPGSFLEIVLH
jgi:predicted peptidase